MSGNVILVDLDGTLASYEKWDGTIGAPVPLMVQRVKSWLSAGYLVRIFTARVAALHLDDASSEEITEAADQYERVREWVREHVGCYLPVTAVKTFDVVEVWDDRAVRVTKNTGVSELHDAHARLDRVLEVTGTLPERIAILTDRYAGEAHVAEVVGQKIDDILRYDIEVGQKPPTFPVSAKTVPAGISLRISTAYRTLPVHDARILVAQILRACEEQETP